jgi:hypothetical protein
MQNECRVSKVSRVDVSKGSVKCQCNFDGDERAWLEGEIGGADRPESTKSKRPETEPGETAR